MRTPCAVFLTERGGGKVNAVHASFRVHVSPQHQIGALLRHPALSLIMGASGLLPRHQQAVRFRWQNMAMRPDVETLQLFQPRDQMGPLRVFRVVAEGRHQHLERSYRAPALFATGRPPAPKQTSKQGRAAGFRQNGQFRQAIGIDGHRQIHCPVALPRGLAAAVTIPIGDCITIVGCAQALGKL